MKCRWGEDQKVPLAGGESDSFSGSKKKDNRRSGLQTPGQKEPATISSIIFGEWNALCDTLVPLCGTLVLGCHRVLKSCKSVGKKRYV
jgi:hypothetical protein|eukprot:COSAG01_NODE_559_length_15469_cov_11.071308_4_plen_88_part_00